MVRSRPTGPSGVTTTRTLAAHEVAEPVIEEGRGAAAWSGRHPIQHTETGLSQRTPPTKGNDARAPHDRDPIPTEPHPPDRDPIATEPHPPDRDPIPTESSTPECTAGDRRRPPQDHLPQPGPLHLGLPADPSSAPRCRRGPGAQVAGPSSGSRRSGNVPGDPRRRRGPLEVAAPRGHVRHRCHRRRERPHHRRPRTRTATSRLRTSRHPPLCGAPARVGAAPNSSPGRHHRGLRSRRRRVRGRPPHGALLRHPDRRCRRAR